MECAFLTADWQDIYSPPPQYFKFSTGGECGIAEIGWVTASINVSVKSSPV